MQRTLRLVVCLLGLIAISNLAQAQENNQPPTGFTALFNGRDTADWTGGATRDPREITAMNATERAEHEASMRRGIDEHWRVEDGELVSDGKEPYLATKTEYGDFEMWVDWMINPQGDSGIYLRGVPQVQIWDPSDREAHRNGADKGSGALWNNQTHERWPKELADKPPGDWNRMFIRMVGPYVSVDLNDKHVVDNVVMENYYDRAIPVFMRGPIYLQTHGAETRFRNVFVREIPYAGIGEGTRRNSRRRGGFSIRCSTARISTAGWGQSTATRWSTARFAAKRAVAATCSPRTSSTISSCGWNSNCRRAATTAWRSAHRRMSTTRRTAPWNCRCWTTRPNSTPSCTSISITAALTAWRPQLAAICGLWANGTIRKSSSMVTAWKCISTGLRFSTRN